MTEATVDIFLSPSLISLRAFHKLFFAIIQAFVTDAKGIFIPSFHNLRRGGVTLARRALSSQKRPRASKRGAGAGNDTYPPLREEEALRTELEAFESNDTNGVAQLLAGIGD